MLGAGVGTISPDSIEKGLRDLAQSAGLVLDKLTKPYTKGLHALMKVTEPWKAQARPWRTESVQFSNRSERYCKILELIMGSGVQEVDVFV
jgi:hypothetical protein